MQRELVKIGDAEVTFETGRIARQATASVLVSQGDSMVLVTLVAAEAPREGADFFPLTVEYRERTSAAGLIPGGYFKREGRISSPDILLSRFIVLSLRPLFPSGYHNEVQIMATVLSQDPGIDADCLAILGAGLAAQIAPIPFNGPVAGARIVLDNGELIAMPARARRKGAEMDIVVSCRPGGLVMVEGEANEVSEGRLLEALTYARESLAPVLEMMERWSAAREESRPEYTEPALDAEVVEAVELVLADTLPAALATSCKTSRKKAIARVEAEAAELLAADFPDREAEIKAAIGSYRYQAVRRMTVGSSRIDGRAHDTVRPIMIETGWLPRSHGSALFTRGETQAMVTCTLAALDEGERVDTLFGSSVNHFMLHYNFPPYSVGETRPLRGPGRREIGHGNLANRALSAVLPGVDEFPYTIRVVSDISESNGSSSMATVCGGCLALMDAGVPVRKPVAGVAMGLIQENGDIAILTDILGDEDHIGDMDFKVAGTVDGITAVQLDNKVGGLEQEILARALEQARSGRLHILERMRAAIATPKDSLSPHAPRVYQERINTGRIRNLIGPGGKTIQELQRSTNSQISVSDDGLVRIYAPDAANGNRALREVRKLTKDPEVGKVYTGVVTGVKDFGVFVRFLHDAEGLVHVSELAEGRVDHPSNEFSVGDEMLIRVLGVDRGGRLKLSRRAAFGADPSEIDD